MILEIMVAIFFIVLLIKCVKDCIRPKNFPNGPTLLPFIGSAWTIPAKGMEYFIPRWKQKYGKLIGHKLYFEKMVVFCGYDEIVEGLKHPNFQGRYHSKFPEQETHNKSLGLFSSDDETWSKVKRFTMRYFGIISTTTLETILHEELLEEFRTIRCEEISNIDENFTKIPLNVILTALTGTYQKDYKLQLDELREKIEKAFKAGRKTGIELVYPFLNKIFKSAIMEEAANATREFLKDRLEEHKKHFNLHGITDYTDAFIKEGVKEVESCGELVNFTDDEFLACATDIIQAGNQTTSKTIQFILMYVSLNQRIQNRLHEEIDNVIGSHRYPVLSDRINMPYLEATIYEGLRIEPIAPTGVIHRVTEDTNFNEYILEKDTMLIFALKHGMHDPDTWRNPDEFIPERFINNNNLKKNILNFGLGKRSCVAEVFVKNYMFLYLAYFFQTYSIQLPVGYKPSITPIVGLTNSPKSFNLVINRRKNL